MSRQEYKTVSLRKADWTHARSIAHHNESSLTQVLALGLRMIQQDMNGYRDAVKSTRFRELLGIYEVD